MDFVNAIRNLFTEVWQLLDTAYGVLFALATGRQSGELQAVVKEAAENQNRGLPAIIQRLKEITSLGAKIVESIEEDSSKNNIMRRDNMYSSPITSGRLSASQRLGKKEAEEDLD